MRWRSAPCAIVRFHHAAHHNLVSPISRHRVKAVHFQQFQQFVVMRPGPVDGRGMHHARGKYGQADQQLHMLFLVGYGSMNSSVISMPK
jgi:hypothetical protein